MALPNDTSILPTNGQVQSASSKRKPARKTAPAAPKRAAPRSAASTEILFTQEPDPSRQPVSPYIWIDHPVQNEALKAPAYALRLGVGGADLVEISIDKSAWTPCRSTSGYWWYDWSMIAPGKHSLIARMRASDGRWFKTPPRLCTYKPE